MDQEYTGAEPSRAEKKPLADLALKLNESDVGDILVIKHIGIFRQINLSSWGIFKIILTLKL